MKLKHILIILCLIVLALLSVYLLINWYALFDSYLLPEYPGLRRLGNRLGSGLGIRMGFPSAGEIAWESPNSILFTDFKTNEIRRLSIKDHRLERVFQDYFALDIHVLPDKRQIAFAGWPKGEGRYLKIWISESDGIPIRIGNDVVEDYEFNPFGWTNDGKSLIVYYLCEPKIDCIGLLQKDTGELITIYKTDQGIDSGFAEIQSGKIAFVTYKHRNVITILDVSLGNVSTINFGGRNIGYIHYIPSKKWVVGVDRGELFFASDDFHCVKKPFGELTSIARVDVMESTSRITLLLKDHSNHLYSLEINETLQREIFDRNSGCILK